MAAKSQASFEFMTAIVLAVVVTGILNTIMLRSNVGTILQSDYLDALNNCEDFSNAVTQTLKVNGMQNSFYNYYNLTINASENFILTSYGHDGDTTFCTLLTKNIVNSTGSNEFTITDGWFLINNTDGLVMVNSV